MRAVIFAAGCSSRLGELTKDIPKCCLPVNEGETILQRCLRLLVGNGIDKVTIVTGHAAQVIDKELIRWHDHFTSIASIKNPCYKERNNIYSAYLVKELIDSETFIINSDLVFDPKILQNAIEAMKNKPNSFLLVDDLKKLTDEGMKVLVDDKGRVVRINKSLRNEAAFGEYIGILRIGVDDLSLFRESLETIVRREEYDKYYEDVLDESLLEMDVRIVSTNGLYWIEVDTKEDYMDLRGQYKL